MKLNKLVLITLLTGLMFSSCSNDDDNNDLMNVSRGNYENGIIISEEGNFSGGNGAVTFISNDLTTIENNVFNNVNSRNLGTVVQSMAFNGDFAYIIVNVSNQIEVVNRFTFESVATITDARMVNPRYMTISNGKGYITNWGDFSDRTDDKVLILDLENNVISGSIPTNYLPEEIISNENTVYVNTGIFDNGDKVDVIDSTSDEVITSVTVGLSPNSIQFDNDGNIWVLSSESLIEIDKADNTIAKTIEFDVTVSPSKLYYSNNNFYYSASNSIFKISETATSVPSASEFSGVSFYDFSVRDNQFFGLDNNSFSSEKSFLRVFDLTNNSEIKSFDLGPFAGEVYFNE